SQGRVSRGLGASLPTERATGEGHAAAQCKGHVDGWPIPWSLAVSMLRSFESKAARLRRRLQDPAPVVVAGAHNGLSAQLVERAGFDAVWASGFEISASFAVPDASILTMAENLEVARGIDRASALPVIADCDNGYGNA